MLFLLSASSAAFDLQQVSWSNESGALYLSYDGARISPWHDVPFSIGEEQGTALLSFVCEIPLHSREKIEIHKSIPFNPLVQDVYKDGSLRFYKYSPSRVNYGRTVDQVKPSRHFPASERLRLPPCRRDRSDVGGPGRRRQGHWPRWRQRSHRCPPAQRETV
jgi:hypothetical protein